MSTQQVSPLQGRWSGTYYYGVDDIVSGHQPVDFEVHIEQVNGNRFHGNVKDGDAGTPGLGTIHGQLKGAVLSFTKRMPIRMVYDEKGVLETDETKPHYPILYTGKLTPDQEYVGGTWRFRKVWIWRGLWPVRVDLGCGRFVMRKVTE